MLRRQNTQHRFDGGFQDFADDLAQSCDGDLALVSLLPKDDPRTTARDAFDSSTSYAVWGFSNSKI